jgi:type III pantothenate kinase
MRRARDVGTSTLVLGGYVADTLRVLSRISVDLNLEADQYAIQLRGILGLYGVSRETIDDIIMASVVPALTPVLLRALGHFTPVKPHLFSLGDADSVRVVIDNPAELGCDILASAVAVRHTRPLPAVIIDMGTATKITALDADGQLLGVSIAPGLYVSLDALVQKASALRGIPLDAPAAAIGRNTPESMKSGVVLGSAAMLDGMIDRFAAEMGGLGSVVATGGAAEAVVSHCRHPVEFCDTLILDGLRITAAARASATPQKAPGG